jgi:lysophospholipase L1-like esterase
MALHTVIVTTRRAGAIASVIVNRGPGGNGGGASVTISATPPADPDEGDQWYDSETGSLAVWDGTVWVGQSNPAVSSAIAALLASTDLAESRAALLDLGGVVTTDLFRQSGSELPSLNLGSVSPFADADADAVITASGTTSSGGKAIYQRVVRLIKDLGLWDGLENAYLLGSDYQSSNTTLKNIKGAGDATGNATHSAGYATFDGVDDKYLFAQVNKGTALTGKTFLAVYRSAGTGTTQQSLISSYEGGSIRGPGLMFRGNTYDGTGPSLEDDVTAQATADGSTLVIPKVPLGQDNKWSIAALSLRDGTLTAYANERTPVSAALGTMWSNNANIGIGANSNSTYFLAGDMCFAAVFGVGITAAQWCALKSGLESIFCNALELPGAVVFEGNSLTASAPGGGTTWPAKLLASTGWTTVSRYANIALDGARQTGRVEHQYFTAARQYLPTAGKDSLFFLWSGINDITASIATATIIASLKRSIIRARLDGFRVVVLTLTPVAPSSGDYTLSYEYGPSQITAIADVNAWIRSTAPELGAQVVDLDEIGDDYPEFLEPWDDTYYVTGDGLHHNDAGRALIAAKVAAEVTPLTVP